MTLIDQADQLRRLVNQQEKEEVDTTDRSDGVDASCRGDEQGISIQTITEPAKEPDRNGTCSPPCDAAPRTRLITIASGKGGVGKSNVAVNLSAQLAQMGRQVILVDADMGLANDDVLCGLSVRWNLSHVISGARQSVSDIVMPAPGGFQLIPGANGIGELADLPEEKRDRLSEELTTLEQSCDTLIFDTSAGISASVISFAAIADTVLVVVTPEPTSIADAYGLIKSVYRKLPEAEVAVLVNCVDNESQGRRVFDRVALVAQKFLHHELHYAGTIPFDPTVRVAVQSRYPFALSHPKCPASKAVVRLAHGLDRQVSDEKASSRTFGFINRFLSWCTNSGTKQPSFQ